MREAPNGSLVRSQRQNAPGRMIKSAESRGDPSVAAGFRSSCTTKILIRINAVQLAGEYRAVNGRRDAQPSGGRLGVGHKDHRHGSGVDCVDAPRFAIGITDAIGPNGVGETLLRAAVRSILSDPPSPIRRRQWIASKKERRLCVSIKRLCRL